MYIQVRREPQSVPSDGLSWMRTHSINVSSGFTDAADEVVPLKTQAKVEEHATREENRRAGCYYYVALVECVATLRFVISLG